MAKVPARELIEEKKPTTLVTSELPSFMQNMDKADHGTQELKQYVTPPRLKFIQKMSGKPYSELFQAGDVVAVPQMLLVAAVEKNAQGRPSDFGAPFTFTPLFFYAEWVLWNPIETRGSLSAIRDRTLDRKSEIAIRAQSPDTWFTKCPELPEKNCRYTEHLNFIIMLHGIENFDTTPVVVSFARTGHKAGKQLSSLVMMRKAPMFGCNFAMRTALTTKGANDWFTPEVFNPPEGDPFVADELMFNAYKALHQEFKETHARGVLRSEYDEETIDAVAAKTEF